jgi:hypothetical protein
MTVRVLRGVRAGALLAALPLLAQAPPAATPAPTPRPGVVTAEEVAVLTLDVIAVDGRNRPVFGLTAADFEVRVAGKVQAIDFFEAPSGAASRAAGAPREGRPDSEERLAGTTTPFDTRGSIRHVLVWVDLEQLPRRSILDTAEALHKAFDHAPAGRYGFATHFGGVSSRVWDADSVESLLLEADRMGAEVAENPEDASVRTRSSPGMASRGSDSPLQYEARKLHEKQLIDALIAVECARRDPREEVQVIADYLAAERRRVKRTLEDLKEMAERFSSLEGPRHIFLVSEGFERVPGFNFLARLQGEEAAGLKECAPAGGSSSASPLLGRGRAGSILPAVPGMPGAAQDLGASRFAFDSGALFEADDLARWLGASGVIVHFIDPGSPGRGLPSAEDKYAFNATLRQDDARNLQETPMRYVSETGGIARLSTNDMGGALAAVLDATTATYRIGVRLQGVDPKKTYSVRVATRKAGVNMLARSAFRPAGPAARAAAALAEDARRAGVVSRADERRPGAARTAKKPIPVTLEWKGRATAASPDPAKPFWKLEVRIPHEELRFETESDAFVASVKIAVEAAAVDGAARDTTADDWFLSYSGAEYREIRDTAASRLVTLQLPPGRYDLSVSVNDALGGTFGQATLRVDAR